MKKWKIVAPVALIAAVGAAVLAFRAKKPGEKPAAPAAKKVSADVKKTVANLKTGSYSFISGYKDAATVELSLQYDADKYSFAVVEEEFLAYSSDSHVAVVSGEDFDLQIEYAAYYQGEDFAALSKEAAEKYQSLNKISYGDNAGIRYSTGDAICLCFPITGDTNSYILMTLFKGKENDDDILLLPEHPELSALLRSMTFSVTK